MLPSASDVQSEEGQESDLRFRADQRAGSGLQRQGRRRCGLWATAVAGCEGAAGDCHRTAVGRPPSRRRFAGAHNDRGPRMGRSVLWLTTCRRRLKLSTTRWRCAGPDGRGLARPRCGSTPGARARTAIRESAGAFVFDFLRPRVPRQQWPARRAARPSVARPRRAPAGDRVSARARSTADRSRGRGRSVLPLRLTRGRQRRPRARCPTPPAAIDCPVCLGHRSANARSSLIGDFAPRRRVCPRQRVGKSRLAEGPPFTVRAERGSSCQASSSWPTRTPRARSRPGVIDVASNSKSGSVHPTSPTRTSPPS